MIWLLRFVPESWTNNNLESNMDGDNTGGCRHSCKDSCWGTRMSSKRASNSQSVARSDCDLEVYSCKMIRVRLNTPGVEEPVSIKKGE